MPAEKLLSLNDNRRRNTDAMLLNCITISSKKETNPYTANADWRYLRPKHTTTRKRGIAIRRRTLYVVKRFACLRPEGNSEVVNQQQSSRCSIAGSKLCFGIERCLGHAKRVIDVRRKLIVRERAPVGHRCKRQTGRQIRTKARRRQTALLLHQRRTTEVIAVASLQRATCCLRKESNEAKFTINHGKGTYGTSPLNELPCKTIVCSGD